MPPHPDLPKQVPRTVITKTRLLQSLKQLDADDVSRARVLAMETDFRRRVLSHVESLPLANATFDKFKTNPFVLLFHALKKKYLHVREIEEDILPAKLFSSMETSAGKMVEKVVLPVYGWTDVPSAMHSENSVLDGMQKKPKVLRLATLKSGPACLNDEMSKDIASDIVAGCASWAATAGVSKIDFTYGVLYGTKRMSNKKDWHILRNIAEQLPRRAILVPPRERWNCVFTKSGVEVEVTVRIGTELWNHIAEDDMAFLEMSAALIRACVPPTDIQPEDFEFTIRDLNEIVSLDVVPQDYNVSIL